MKKITRSNIGKIFHETTCFKRSATVRKPEIECPPLYKDYTEKRQFELPYPDTSKGPKIWDAILMRRSRREFARSPIEQKELSLLLWAAQGKTGTASDHRELRAAPSAGARYPIETYVAVNHVKKMFTGVYHYNLRGHSLSLLYSKDVIADLVNISIEQEFVYNSAVVFIWTAVVDRCRSKYGERAFRYMYLDAGHIGQNLLLAAQALGLYSCPIGALYDDEANAFVKADGDNEVVVYMAAVGNPDEPEHPGSDNAV